ncbi:MAG: hypothetical protein ACI8PZ_006044 [Myxococcota bacterium]|jgi:hypothetical protein
MIAFLLTWVALATQDDVRLPLDPPARWLPVEEGVTPLPTLLPQASLAVYPVGGPVHVWHGRVEVEVGQVGFGPRAAWTGGLSMETVADDRNSIDFRLVRLFYDAHQEARFALGPGVAHVGYRHRCSHGADDAVEDRILIRSGPAMGWVGEWTSGRWIGRAGGDLEWTLLGQNPDREFQPRGLVDTVGAIEVDLGRQVGWVTSAGLGWMLVGSGAPWWWGPTAPVGPAHWVALPAAATGPTITGRGGTLRALVHLQRLADSGVGAKAQPTTLLSVRVELAPARQPESVGGSMNRSNRKNWEPM